MCGGEYTTIGGGILRLSIRPCCVGEGSRHLWLWPVRPVRRRGLTLTGDAVSGDRCVSVCDV